MRENKIKRLIYESNYIIIIITQEESIVWLIVSKANWYLAQS